MMTWDVFLGRIDGETGILRRWIVNMLETPEDRSRPYLLLYSPGLYRSGRSAFVDALGMLKDVTLVRRPPIGCFNSQLDQVRPVVFIDDGEGAKLKANYRYIKEDLPAWVSKQEITISRQYQASKVVKNTTSWVQMESSTANCLVPNYLALRVPPVDTPMLHEQLMADLKATCPFPIAQSS